MLCHELAATSLISTGAPDCSLVCEPEKLWIRVVDPLPLSTAAVCCRSGGEELASAQAKESAPDFRVVVEGISRNLHPILRDEVYRLGTEALRNAFRHAAAKNVEVEIRYD